MSSEKAQLMVIGAGPGGYAAAFMAADLGVNVTLVDPEPNPGGVCLYRGCIPSKALLHIAQLIIDNRTSEDIGITFGEPEIFPKKIKAWKDQVVDQLTGGLGQLSKHRKINRIRGKAHFVDNKTLTVNDKEYTFDNCILATGTLPATLPGQTFESDKIWDSTDALALDDIPDSMLVVGGGYIGLELGYVYAALGCKVSLVEMTSGLLPGMDRDLVSVLTKKIKPFFKDISLDTKVSSIEPTKQQVKVELENKNGKKKENFKTVFVAIGRKANISPLKLENTDIETDNNDFIKVDEQLRTSIPNIFAIGDMTGQPFLAHRATHQGRIAAEVVSGKNVIYDPAVIPAVIYSQPEIATCGLSETEAKEEGIDIEISKFPWAASGRSLTMGKKEGMTKLIIDPSTERILGAGIVGPYAGELIGEAAVAVEMAAQANDLGLTVHPHPTLSETLMEAANAWYGTSTHIYRPKRKAKRREK
ncbi:dihydrolipoyl dehydrogenase [candidate division KSB1 bacterium]|nr:dihydrolipoyl dehydrogenase [candidate division KSB1 bacterium]